MVKKVSLPFQAPPLFVGKMKLRLIGSSQTRAFRCLWMLEELRVPYEIVPVMAATKSAFDYNPSGKVPALVVTEDERTDSFTITESAVINTFLGDRFPDSGLVPKFLSRDRIKYDELTMSIMTELDAAVWAYHKHVVLGKFFGYIPDIEKASMQQFEKMNSVMLSQLKSSGGPFLLGNQFTAIDILYGHCLDWAKVNGWKTVLELYDVVSYMEVYKDRPAYQRAKEIRSNEKIQISNKKSAL